MKTLVVSIGCPSGIGPEVSVAAALRMRGVKIVLVGDIGALTAASPHTHFARVSDPREKTPRGSIAVIQPTHPLSPSDRRPGSPSKRGGAAQLAWIDAATDLVKAGRADALVTGPVSKDAIARSGAPGSKGFLGHTEHLQRRLKSKEVTMAFASEHVTSSLVTTHLRLADVPKAIDAKNVARAIYWTAWLAHRLQDTRTIAVASLNPHAGENGLLGNEEPKAIVPGMALAKKRLAKDGIAVRMEGPVPAESAFRLAKSGRYGSVVAMYHDQATIAMKLLGFGEAVNLSLGLPIVRTSVDHGTAYDRAGKGTADPRGMLEAMKLAARLA